MGILFVDNGEVRTFDLNGSSTIGRDGTNDIIVKHPTVSRTHARINSDKGGQFFLTDFSSRNGTRINGRAVAPNGEPLQNGARLRIGHVRAWFYLKMPEKLPRSLSNRDAGVVFNCACGQRLWSATDTAGMSVVCNNCNQNVEDPRSSEDDDDASGKVTGAQLDVEAADATNICGICQWPIDAHEASHVCPACNMPSHQECWMENLGCSTYGCSQVNALVPKVRPAEPVLGAGPEPFPEIIPEPVEAKSLAWGHMLLGLSVVASLLGLVAFGIPSAVLALVALIRLLTTRDKDRPVLTAAVLIAVLGAAAGVMISRLWWLGKPLFSGFE
ncbi:MAG: transporter ATP-binding protein [Phycisphaerales bacterium]|nr:transporter ATP-binding protein [Phycisphaerales bacterium]